MNAALLIIFRVMIFLSVALLVIGMVKPEWLRFRQKQPGRTTIIAVAIGILMIGFAGAGAIQYAAKIMLRPFIMAKCLVRLFMQSTIIRYAATQEQNPVMPAPAMMKRHRRVFAIW